MLSVVNANTPSSPVVYRGTDISIVHAAVAGRTQHDEILGREALRRRVLGQMEQVVNLAVQLSLLHLEATFAAELASRYRLSRSFHVPRDRARPLIRLQHTLNLP